MTQLLDNNEHAQINPVTRWKVLEGRQNDFAGTCLRLKGFFHRLQPEPYIMNSAQTNVLPSGSRPIPSRRIVVNDPGQMPMDYSTTPGGTIFSTTPGGTRIIYERKFLLDLRNSPLSRTPPRNLPLIPGVTCDEKVKPESPLKDNGVVTTEPENDKNDHAEQEEPQFEMDI